MGGAAAGLSRGAAPVAGAGLGAAAGVGLVVAAWSAVGPHHAVFPVLVTALWFGAAAFVGPGLAAVLPRGWFRVPDAEVRWHRRLGVARFDRLLEVTGWNRVVRAMRSQPVPLQRSALAGLRRHVEAAMAGHGAAAAVHAVVGVLCLSAGARGSAGVVLAAGGVLHVGPVLLQRSTLARIQRVPRPPGR